MLPQHQWTRYRWKGWSPWYSPCENQNKFKYEIYIENNGSKHQLVVLNLHFSSLLQFNHRLFIYFIVETNQSMILTGLRNHSKQSSDIHFKAKALASGCEIYPHCNMASLQSASGKHLPRKHLLRNPCIDCFSTACGSQPFPIRFKWPSHSVQQYRDNKLSLRVKGLVLDKMGTVCFAMPKCIIRKLITEVLCVWYGASWKESEIVSTNLYFLTRQFTIHQNKQWAIDNVKGSCVIHVPIKATIIFIVSILVAHVK